MRIRIRDISPDGLKVSDSISLENLNARMNEAKDNDIVFTSAPQIDVTVFKSPMGAETKGKVTARYKQPCARCVEPLEREVTGSLDYIFQVTNDKSPRGEWAAEDEEDQAGGPDEPQDDIGIVFFQGEHIELEGLAQEALIIALDPFWSPPCDQQGACSVCKRGADLVARTEQGKSKETINFGDLLKQAKPLR